MPLLSLPPPGSPGFVQIRFARSSWLKSTPESITATTTPAPFVESQAVSAEIPRPSDIRFHCWSTQLMMAEHSAELRNSGSLGTVMAEAGRAQSSETTVASDPVRDPHIRGEVCG